VAKRKRKSSAAGVAGFLGLGLDDASGHSRVTQTDHFLLAGGSAETHERLQETAIRFEERLEKTGRPLPQLPREQVIDMLRQARRE
jgi:hypothetical protein